MSTLEEQLRDYATAVAGRPRHLEPVNDEDPGHVPRSWMGRVVLVGVLLVFVGLAALALTVTRSGDDRPAPSTDGTVVTPDEGPSVAPSGFSFYPFVDPETGEDMIGYVTFVPLPGSIRPALLDPVEVRIPVFAEGSVNSAVVGYDYSFLGFVPKRAADAPTFDSRALYLGHFGCDPRDDSAVDVVSCRDQALRIGPREPGS
jgi:hypothetical protein